MGLLKAIRFCKNIFNYPTLLFSLFFSYTIKRNRISREWRQKIESWLQSNEQDDKQSGEDYRRRARRLAGNRRSFENDSGNFENYPIQC